MIPDQRHPGRETERSLGLKQVFLGASANVPSSLPYCRFIPPPLLPRSTASLHLPTLDPGSSISCQWSSKNIVQSGSTQCLNPKQTSRTLDS